MEHAGHRGCPVRPANGHTPYDLRKPVGGPRVRETGPDLRVPRRPRMPHSEEQQGPHEAEQARAAPAPGRLVRALALVQLPGRARSPGRLVRAPRRLDHGHGPGRSGPPRPGRPPFTRAFSPHSSCLEELHRGRLSRMAIGHSLPFLFLFEIPFEQRSRSVTPVIPGRGYPRSRAGVARPALADHVLPAVFSQVRALATPVAMTARPRAIIGRRPIPPSLGAPPAPTRAEPGGSPPVPARSGREHP